MSQKILLRFFNYVFILPTWRIHSPWHGFCHSNRATFAAKLCDSWPVAYGRRWIHHLPRTSSFTAHWAIFLLSADTNSGTKLLHRLKCFSLALSRWKLLERVFSESSHWGLSGSQFSDVTIFVWETTEFGNIYVGGGFLAGWSSHRLNRRYCLVRTLT